MNQCSFHCDIGVLALGFITYTNMKWLNDSDKRAFLSVYGVTEVEDLISVQVNMIDNGYAWFVEHCNEDEGEGENILSSILEFLT